MAASVTLLAILLAWLTASGPVWALDLQTYTGQPGRSLVQISGTSTLCDWDAAATDIQGLVQFAEDNSHYPPLIDVDFPIEGADKGKVAFTVPIRSLKSKTPGLAEAIWKDLNYKKHPNIKYCFIEAVQVASPAEGTHLIDLYGILYVNGVGRFRKLRLEITHPSPNKLILKSTVTIKMTEYGITPPTYLGGLVRSGDNVKIKIRWIMNRCQPPVNLAAQYWPQEPDLP